MGELEFGRNWGGPIKIQDSIHCCPFLMCSVSLSIPDPLSCGARISLWLDQGQDGPGLLADIPQGSQALLILIIFVLTKHLLNKVCRSHFGCLCPSGDDNQLVDFHPVGDFDPLRLGHLPSQPPESHDFQPHDGNLSARGGVPLCPGPCCPHCRDGGALAWARRMACWSREAGLWKRPTMCRLWCWIRLEPSLKAGGTFAVHVSEDQVVRMHATYMIYMLSYKQFVYQTCIVWCTSTCVASDVWTNWCDDC